MYKEITVLPLITQIKMFFNMEIVDFAILKSTGFMYAHSDLVLEHVFALTDVANALKIEQSPYKHFKLHQYSAIMFYDGVDAYLCVVFYEEQPMEKTSYDDIHRRLLEVSFFKDHLDIQKSSHNLDHDYAIFGVDFSGRINALNHYAYNIFKINPETIYDLEPLFHEPARLIDAFKKSLATGKGQMFTIETLTKQTYRVNCMVDAHSEVIQFIMTHSPTASFYQNILDSYDYLRLGVVHFDLVFDASGEPCDARILYANERYGKMMGVSTRETIGKTIYEIEPTYPKERFEQYARVGIKGTRSTFENYIPAADKHFHVHSFAPVKNEFINVYYETTHFHRMKTTEKIQFRKMEMMLTLAEMGFFEIDIEKQSVTGDAFVQNIFGKENIDYETYRSFFRHRIHPDDVDRVREKNKRLMMGSITEGSSVFQVDLKGDAHYIYIEFYLQTIKSDPSGRPLKVLGLMRDVTNIHQSQKKLEYLADHDQLSGLYNRHHLFKRVENKDFACPIIIAMIDLDGLKTVNDVFGHFEGDKVIERFSHVLKETYDTAYIARLGGDEFVILFERTVPNFKACEKLLRQKLSEFYEFKLPLGMSIGYAELTNLDHDINKTIADAEAAMYRQKLLERPKRKKRTLRGLLQYLYKHEPELKERIERMKRHGVAVMEKHGFIRKDEQEKLKLAFEYHAIGRIMHYLHDTKPQNQESLYYGLNVEGGFKVLSSLLEQESVCKAILHQCEHYDGSGEPLGLKADKIPLHARIMAIVITFELLTKNDYFGRKHTTSEALNVLKKGSGTLFDPVLVESFAKLL